MILSHQIQQYSRLPKRRGPVTGRCKGFLREHMGRIGIWDHMPLPFRNPPHLSLLDFQDEENGCWTLNQDVFPIEHALRIMVWTLQKQRRWTLFFAGFGIGSPKHKFWSLMILRMGIFQPTFLVYQKVYPPWNYQQEPLKMGRSPRMKGLSPTIHLQRC